MKLQKIKDIALRRGIPFALSGMLSLTAILPAVPVAASQDGSVMNRIIADAAAETNERIRQSLETGDLSYLRDDSFYNPDETNQNSRAFQLPAKYDMREYGEVSPVKLQNPYGTCWAFAAIAAAESSLLSQTGLSPEVLDLSEKHLAWFSANHLPANSETGQGNEGTYSSAATDYGYNSGGFVYTGTTAFASGLGPRLEIEFPYQPKDPENNIYFGTDGNPLFYKGGYVDPDHEADWSLDEKDRFGPVMCELVESALLPSPATKKDGVYQYNEAGTRAIKRELMAGRAVAISFRADTSRPGQGSGGQYINTDNWAHYTYEPRSISHGVTIVGWDDDYAVSNFLEGHEPPAPGAWIVKNSWGAASNEFPHKRNWGLDGYFYLSYYDQSIDGPESFNLSIKDLKEGGRIVFDQYDYMVGYDFDTHEVDQKVSEANVFKVEYNMALRSVAITANRAGAMVTYDIYRLNDGATLPTDGTLECTIERTYEYAGFHREDVPKKILFWPGERYSVVVTQESDGKYVYGASFGASKKYWEEKGDLDSDYQVAVVNKGESFLGTWDEKNGYAWEDWRDYLIKYNKEIEYRFAIDNFPIKAYSDVIEEPTDVDLSKYAEVTLDAETYTYNGKAQKPVVTVKVGELTLESEKYYTVSYQNNKNAGTATVTVTAKEGSGCTGSVTKEFTIAKAAQALKLNVSKKNYKVADLARKKATFTIKPSGNKAAVTYKVTKGSSKYISVSQKGVVTMKKGAKKGTYIVTVTAKEAANYKSAKKTVTIIVK